jgi:hypothetical protein
MLSPTTPIVPVRALSRIAAEAHRGKRTMLTTETQQMEKRLNRRAKVSRMLRVRSSDPEVEYFEELPVSVNASKQGIYFHTNRSDYYQGMRLFITFPFTFAQDPMKCEYLAEIVRLEQLVNGRAGVAVRLLMTV